MANAQNQSHSWTHTQDASHRLSKKRHPRKGRRQRRPEETYVAIRARVRQAIRTTTKAQAKSSARRRSTAPPAKVGPPAPPPAARLMSGLGCPPAPKRRGFNHHGEEGDVLGCACIGCLQMPALVNDLEPSGIERKQLCSHPEGAPERVAVPSFQK